MSKRKNTQRSKNFKKKYQKEFNNYAIKTNKYQLQELPAKDPKQVGSLDLWNDKA